MPHPVQSGTPAPGILVGAAMGTRPARPPLPHSVCIQWHSSPCSDCQRVAPHHPAVLPTACPGREVPPAVVLLMLLIMGTVGALYTRGLRLVLQAPSPTGALWGLALIRSGRPVEGVAPGMLLVASRDLSHTVFQESVILLLNYSATRGAEGVMLTQPISHSRDMPATWSHLLLGRQPRATVPTSKAPSTRQTHSGRGGEDIGGAASGAGPSPEQRSPEQLWEDVVRRFESRLFLQQHFGGPVGLSLHGLGEGSGDEPHMRDYSGSGWTRVGHTARDVTVLHDVPGVSHTKLVIGSDSHGPEVPSDAGQTSDAACAMPVSAAAQSAKSWKRARFTATSHEAEPAKQHRSSSDSGAQPGACWDADTRAQHATDAASSGMYWVGNSPSEVLYQATQLLLPRSTGLGSTAARNATTAEQGNLSKVGMSDGVNATSGRPRFRVLVFYGKSGWAPGQLDGELRSGAWGLAPATQDDMDHAVTDPHTLWSHLMASGRLTWL